MDPQQITELANLLRKNGDKILSSEFTLTLSGSLVRALNDSFTLIADSDIGAAQQHFQVVKPINAKSNVFPDLQLLHDFVQKTTLLRIVYYASEPHFAGAIDIAKFHELRRLELQKIDVRQVVGIQPLRAQLEHIICVKSLRSVEDIITRCGGDNSNGFVWNRLTTADFSHNNLQSVDTSLEFAQNLQHLSLRHNRLHSVTAIKWLPQLRTLDLSYNCLTHVPQFHAEACKRLQQLNVSNNYVEDLMDVMKLQGLLELNLSDNCLLEHTQLLPLSNLAELRVLLLFGNPLHCHAKHRQATALYLHRNTATRAEAQRFLLDAQPLTKAERALTGSQRLRHLGSLQHSMRSSASAITGSRSTATNSAASSVESRRSAWRQDSSSEAEQSGASHKRRQKVRTVNIEEQEDVAQVSALDTSMHEQTNAHNEAHLQTKQQIETLREKYGTEWLTSSHAELGLPAMQNSEEQRQKSRQLFNDFLGEYSTVSDSDVETLNVTSTPTNEGHLAAVFDNTLTPIKAAATTTNEATPTTTENTEYFSFDASVETQYASTAADPHAHLRDFYATTSNDADQEEALVSDTEDDEETYLVYNANKPSESFFLTISSNFLREKDTLTERTKAKWSLKILESCERIKTNTLRIHFDTIKKDKKERIYNVENPLCQELEKKLRDILSKRDLTEMNISIYRCVNCGSQFTREHKQMHYKVEELRCPDCRSTFIAEVHEMSSSLDKAAAGVEPKLSPALIVEESLTLDNNSIVATNRLNANNTPKRRSLLQTNKSSANSLNESSSCSKITNSQCSFDSNQSVVGSSNTERDLEFRANESDVDIISNPSQSSIEVLDPNCAQSASRKTSEERQNIVMQTQSFIEREFAQMLAEKETATTTPMSSEPKSKTLVHVQLTESSSSGSVTDSICTAYEQKEQQQQPAPNELESNNNEQQPRAAKKEDAGLSYMFGALFQSTNMLMSSSKKLIEAEAIASPTLTQPYKFNYSDFKDIDHRLKLYFYQGKFEEIGEHFLWLVRACIYNEQTQTLCDGLVVMSTCKLYVMEAFGPPHDDVAKWLRQLCSVTSNRLTGIRLLPWKLGLSFTLRDWGGFLLLLQDILRTDSLLLYFANCSLPADCELQHKPDPSIMQRLSAAVGSEPLKMCALLSGCECICGTEKSSLQLCALLATDTHLYLSASKFNWLSTVQQPNELQLGRTQLMSNLVDLERLSDEEFNINFLDETQNKYENWHVKFATKENALCCLNAIDESWQQLFGVPLLNA